MDRFLRMAGVTLVGVVLVAAMAQAMRSSWAEIGALFVTVMFGIFAVALGVLAFSRN